MTRKMTKSPFPRALVSSTLGTILVSIAAVWLSTSLVYAPAIAVSDKPEAAHSDSYKPSSRSHFRLSPIPRGADWTS
ncbi:MAG: hypothetical protein ACOYB4_09855 [Methyloceanibacter sp.]